MKKILLALAIAASAQVSAFAQNYSFSKTTGTYANLTGATALSAAGWDEDDYLLPIGFNFSIGNQSVSQAAVTDNGEIYFIDMSTSTPSVKGIALPFFADMMDRGSSATPSVVSASTTGTAGSRITKIEWKNAGFYDGNTSTQTTSVPYPNDFVNFQVWLYEGSNNMEIHFGSNNITAANSADIFGSTGGAITTIINGITGTGQSSTYSGVALQGPAATPTMITLTNATGASIPSVTGVPTNGTIYRFTTSTTGITKDLNNTAISLYPNPVADVMAIKGLTAKGNVTINVTDVVGKIVLTENVAAAQNISVNVSNLKKGAYTVEISSEEGRSIKQIIKQ